MRHSLVALVLFGALSCDKNKDEVRTKAIEQTQIEFAALGTHFARIASAWPADGAPAEVCPDAAIAKEAEAARLVVMVDWEAVLKLADSAHAAEVSETSLSHKRLGRLDRTDSWGVRQATQILEQRPYLGVWRPAEFVPAQGIDTQTFRGGHARGRIVLFDYRTGAALCWAEVATQSQKEVEYRTRQSVDSQKRADADRAARVDLVMQVQRAIAAAVGGKSNALKVGPLSWID